MQAPSGPWTKFKGCAGPQPRRRLEPAQSQPRPSVGMSCARSALWLSQRVTGQACVGMRSCPLQKRTPEIKAAIAACVKDGSRMAETAKRAWFTTAWPEALAKGDAHSRHIKKLRNEHPSFEHCKGPMKCLNIFFKLNQLVRITLYDICQHHFLYK